MPTQPSSSRIACIDLLRGFDLFVLFFLGPVLLALTSALQSEALAPVARQFEHAAWEGFRFWDIIMPLFLFITGTAMPFSLAKYAGNRRALWKKVVRRFAVLFLLGMLVQGNVLALNPNDIHIYVNTLQAIATGYLISAFILTRGGLRVQMGLTALLLLIYWVPMTFCGDWTPTGNFAYRVDQLLMGRFCGDASYTWIWSSLTFGVTVMLGCFAGQIIRRGRGHNLRTLFLLLGVGIALVAAGWLWSLQIPIIKRIWTCSMTLYSGGLCFLLLALFFFLTDMLKAAPLLSWLRIYGCNSITAYVVGSMVSFGSIVHSLSYGLEQYLGADYYGVWTTFGNAAILFLLLWQMYSLRIFIKI